MAHDGTGVAQILFSAFLLHVVDIFERYRFAFCTAHIKLLGKLSKPSQHLIGLMISVLSNIGFVDPQAQAV